MSKHTVETPRSERFYQTAPYQLFPVEPRTLSPILNEEIVRLARLFAKEERLATLIADEDGVVDKDTVYEIVTVARKVAKEGYSTTLVSTDEMMDIAQIFSTRHPDSASRIQKLHHDRRRMAVTYPRFPKDTIELLIAQVTYPDRDTAAALLIELLASLGDEDNPVWTARVAAVLAYFSLSSPRCRNAPRLCLRSRTSR